MITTKPLRYQEEGLSAGPALQAWCLGALVVALGGFAGAARAQTQTPPSSDVIGMHDLSPGGPSPLYGTLSGSCLYCHAPHSGLNGTAGVVHTPLWNQELSKISSYTLYSGPTTNPTISTLPLGSNSTLCLSCHDGTVGGSTSFLSPGHLAAYGTVAMSGTWNPGDMLGTNLSTMHPINFKTPLVAAPDLFQGLSNSPPSTNDPTGKVRLIYGNVQCGSCHNPHVQNVNQNDQTDPYFLVLDNSSGALCLACHSPVPTGTGMGLSPTTAASQSVLRPAEMSIAGGRGTTKPNPLGGWLTSIHATASNRVPHQITVQNTIATATGSVTSKSLETLGTYGTVARNACSSCHATHNAKGTNALLRGADDQACIICHNGASNTSPPTSNILAETTAPKYGHPFSPGNSGHLPDEGALLNQNRHVTCADCHNAHTAIRVASFPVPPAIRLSQKQVVGISASDGKTVVTPASNQYENCLRCHGSSIGKLAKASYGYLPVWTVASSDPLNVIPEFSNFATSSHPVFHDRLSPFPQPSLRANMLNLDGASIGRSMGTRILCTDCHNSDDNREFGGSGPSGPHGSIFPHILERRYEFSQAGAPGTAVTNLFPNPNLNAQGGASGGPYALCAKCHDLAQIVNNTSFSEHERHIKDGFSCSTCHTAHGMGAQAGTISGQRLVNFDIKVVAPNGAVPVSYNRATNSCALVCHNHAHQLRTAGGAAKR